MDFYWTNQHSSGYLVSSCWSSWCFFFFLHLLVSTIRTSVLWYRGSYDIPSLGGLTSDPFNTPVLKDLGYLVIPWAIILAYCIDVIRLIEISEQEVANILLHLNKTHACQGVRPQNSGLENSVKFLGILGISGIHWDNHYKVKDKWLQPVRKMYITPRVPLWVLKQSILHLGTWIWSIYWVIC